MLCCSPANRTGITAAAHFCSNLFFQNRNALVARQFFFLPRSSASAPLPCVSVFQDSLSYFTQTSVIRYRFQLKRRHSSIRRRSKTPGPVPMRRTAPSRPTIPPDSSHDFPDTPGRQCSLRNSRPSLHRSFFMHPGTKVTKKNSHATILHSF